MKRITICMLVVTMLLTGCGTDLEVEVKKNTTYHLEEVTIEYEDGNTTEIDYLFEEHQNVPSHAAVYYENDEKIGQETYVRDENGNIISSTPDWDGGVAKTYEYSYDNEKRIIEKKEFVEGVLQTRTVIEYGENGKEEKVTVYDKDDKLVLYQEFIYDGDSKRTVNEYDADGNLLRYMKHVYTYADVVAKEELYSTEDELVSTTIWHYVPFSETEYYIGEFDDTQTEEE